MPGGFALPDARQLCFRLYCTVDGVPSELQPQCSRPGLADAFAELARTGWIAEYGKQAGETDFWLEEITSILRPGPDVVDLDHGDRIARLAGFGG